MISTCKDVLREYEIPVYNGKPLPCFSHDISEDNAEEIAHIVNHPTDCDGNYREIYYCLCIDEETFNKMQSESFKKEWITNLHNEIKQHLQKNLCPGFKCTNTIDTYEWVIDTKSYEEIYLVDDIEKPYTMDELNTVKRFYFKFPIDLEKMPGIWAFHHTKSHDIRSFFQLSSKQAHNVCSN